MKRLIFLIGLSAVYTMGLTQEEKSAYHVFINGNLQSGIPMDAFRENLDAVGFGGGGIILLQLGRLPVFAGLELSGMTYDSESQDYDVNIGGFLRRYRLRTANNIFLIHGAVRFQPEVNFPIRPYFDGMIGFKNLYTRTTLTDRDADTTESDTDRRDWAFSYGGALGLQLAIFRNPGITLDLRCAYLPGANATYLVRRANDGGPLQDPIDAFEEKASPTNLLMPQIGVTFNLSSQLSGDEY